MHVLIIPSWYSTRQNPIRGSFFRDQALALLRHGHQVGMLVPPSRFRTLHGLKEALDNWPKAPSEIAISNDNGIIIYRIPWWGWLGSINLAQRLKTSLAVFDRYAEAHGKPDVLHGHSILYGGYLATEIAAVRQAASIVTEHNTDIIAKQLQWGQAKLIRATAKKTGKLLAVSPSLSIALQAYSNRPVDIVENLVDTEFFVPAQTKLTDSPFVFSIIGSLTQRKGHADLLQAFAQEFKAKDCILNIAGQGAEKANLIGQCQRLGIEKQVKFLGLLNREAIRDLLQATHVLVSASYLETFGVTLIEAMSCGKPIVATRSGGPEHFIDERSGILVPTADIPALAAALIEIRNNYANYQPETIREIAVKRFSEKAIAAQLTNHYESLFS